jgi:MoxR-like ATPase
VEGSIAAVDDARDSWDHGLDDGELARELAATTAADLAELVELAVHLDHRLRHGAGLPDPPGSESVSPSTVQIDGETVIDAMQQALGEAEAASIALRGALERAHHLAERLRRI